MFENIAEIQEDKQRDRLFKEIVEGVEWGNNDTPEYAIPVPVTLEDIEITDESYCGAITRKGFLTAKDEQGTSHKYKFEIFDDQGSYWEPPYYECNVELVEEK